MLLIQCKISLYLGPVRPVQCFVTPLITVGCVCSDFSQTDNWPLEKFR